MATENHWKEKYLSALDASEAIEARLKDAEDTLRLTVSRLALAASGSDKTLDEQLEKLKSQARKSPNNASVRKLLEDISVTIKRLDIETSAGKPQRLPAQEFLGLIVRKTEFPQTQKKQAAALEKKLRHRNAADALEQHLSDFIALINAAVHTVISEPPAKQVEQESGHKRRYDGAELVAELAAQLRKKFTKDGTLLDACLNLEQASTGKELNAALNRLVQLLPARSDKDTVIEESPADRQPQEPLSLASPEMRFRELLDRLSLPASLNDRAIRIRQQLEKDLSPSEWPPLLSDIADIVALMRSEVEREKSELQAFLFQITAELKNIDVSLLNTEAQNIESLKSGEQLDDALRSNLSELRTSVETEDDLGNLRQLISQRMENISSHLQDYRDAEIRRQQEVSAEIKTLRSRVRNMESETTELNEKLAAEREQARTDSLTGIGNRTAYEQRLEEEFARWKKGETGLSIVVCDVDHFKKLNDSLGHQAGDKALQSIATVLKQNVRKSDLLARYGGEEFVVLIPHEPDTEQSITARIAEKIRSEVELAEFKSKGRRIPITISCGYSLFQDGDEKDAAFGRADQALYRAKERGRNRVEGDALPI